MGNDHLVCALILLDHYLFTVKKAILFQGTFRIATWRGIQVAVKKLGEDLITDEDKVWVGSINIGIIFLCEVIHLLISLKPIFFFVSSLITLFLQEGI